MGGEYRLYISISVLIKKNLNMKMFRDMLKCSGMCRWGSSVQGCAHGGGSSVQGCAHGSQVFRDVPMGVKYSRMCPWG